MTQAQELTSLYSERAMLFAQLIGGDKTVVGQIDNVKSRIAALEAIPAVLAEQRGW